MANDKLEDYSQLRSALGYFFQSQALLVQALTYRSMRVAHNERLEFLGDSILGMVIAAALYAQYPNEKEGVLSRARSYLVNGDMLAIIAKELTLDKYVILGHGEMKTQGERRVSILSGCFEAIIGGIYLDGGFTSAERCVLSWYETRLQGGLVLPDLKDAKSQLQEWTQAQQYPLPIYTMTVSGKAHEQVFSVTCRIEGLSLETTAESQSRRKAEQLAAKRYLEEKK